MDNNRFSKVEKFALNMKKIPRKALRCEIYDTVSVVVDERHATNVLLKCGDPAATGSEIYRALIILQDRLEERHG